MAIVPDFVDFDRFGRIDGRGNPLVHIGGDALGNALATFCTAKAGGYVLRPTEGGILDDLVFRAQRGQLDQKAVDVSKALNAEFGAFLTVNTVSITPDPKTARLLQVEIRYTVNATQEKKKLLVFRKFTPKYSEERNYIPVNFIEENLTNFILAEQLTQPKAPLFFNPKVNSWVWGPYKLVNFGTTSANFEYLLNLLNG